MSLKNNRIFRVILILYLILDLNVFVKANIFWDAQSFSSTDTANIAYLNGVFVLASGEIYTSDDAKTWDLTFSPLIFSSFANGSYNQVYALNNMFIATGENVQPIKSEDGKEWTFIRLHENIPAKDIHVMGDTFFWSDSPTSLSYSKTLLAWDNVPLPVGEKIINMKFVNDKCFLSTKSNKNAISCWMIDETLIPKLLDIDSIDNISYLPEIEKYIDITLVNSPKKVYIFSSSDGMQWQKTDYSINGSTDFNLDDSDFETLNLNDKIFLRLGDEVYITSNASIWFKINNYGNFKNLKYSGLYFYNINNSKDVFLSKDGISWNNFSLPNKINSLSSINIYDNILLLSHVDYNIKDESYTTTIYTNFINSYDENIEDINNDNTNYFIEND